MATFSEVSSDYGVDEELSRDLQALREILENEEQPLQPGSASQEEGTNESQSPLEGLQKCLSKNRELQAQLHRELVKVKGALTQNQQKRNFLTNPPRGFTFGKGFTMWKFRRGMYFKDRRGKPVPTNIDTPTPSSNSPSNYLTCWSFWRKDKEVKMLKKSMRVQIIEKCAEPLTNALAQTKDPDEIRRLRRKINELRHLDSKELFSSLEDIEINWNEVADTVFNNSKSAIDCEVHWNNVLSPLVNTGPWSKDEDLKLITLVNEYNCTNWRAIASGIKTGRSAFECLKRYQLAFGGTTNNNKIKWTPEQDRRLHEGVKKHGEKRWRAVSNYVGHGRTHSQCLHRWYNTINPEIKKGRWSNSEDERLYEAVELYGVGNWSRVATQVPSRTAVQCRERWVNVLDTNLKKGKWSKEEEDKLIALCSAYGSHPIKWSKVAQEFGNRTDAMCSQHWRSRSSTSEVVKQYATRVKEKALHVCRKHSHRTTLASDEIEADMLPGNVQDRVKAYEKRMTKKSRSLPLTDAVFLQYCNNLPMESTVSIDISSPTPNRGKEKATNSSDKTAGPASSGRTRSKSRSTKRHCQSSLTHQAYSALLAQQYLDASSFAFSNLGYYSSHLYYDSMGFPHAGPSLHTPQTTHHTSTTHETGATTLPHYVQPPQSLLPPASTSTEVIGLTTDTLNSPASQSTATTHLVSISPSVNSSTNTVISSACPSIAATSLSHSPSGISSKQNSDNQTPLFPKCPRFISLPIPEMMPMQSVPSWATHGVPTCLSSPIVPGMSYHTRHRPPFFQSPSCHVSNTEAGLSATTQTTSIASTQHIETAVSALLSLSNVPKHLDLPSLSHHQSVISVANGSNVSYTDTVASLSSAMTTTSLTTGTSCQASVGSQTVTVTDTTTALGAATVALSKDIRMTPEQMVLNLLSAKNLVTSIMSVPEAVQCLSALPVDSETSKWAHDKGVPIIRVDGPSLISTTQDGNKSDEEYLPENGSHSSDLEYVETIESSDESFKSLSGGERKESSDEDEDNSLYRCFPTRLTRQAKKRLKSLTRNVRTTSKEMVVPLIRNAGDVSECIDQLETCSELEHCMARDPEQCNHQDVVKVSRIKSKTSETTQTKNQKELISIRSTGEGISGNKTATSTDSQSLNNTVHLPSASDKTSSKRTPQHTRKDKHSKTTTLSATSSESGRSGKQGKSRSIHTNKSPSKIANSANLRSTNGDSTSEKRKRGQPTNKDGKSNTSSSAPAAKRHSQRKKVAQSQKSEVEETTSNVRSRRKREHEEEKGTPSPAPKKRQRMPATRVSSKPTPPAPTPSKKRKASRRK